MLLRILSLSHRKASSLTHLACIFQGKNRYKQRALGTAGSLIKPNAASLRTQKQTTYALLCLSRFHFKVQAISGQSREKLRIQEKPGANLLRRYRYSNSFYMTGSRRVLPFIVVNQRGFTRKAEFQM